MNLDDVALVENYIFSFDYLDKCTQSFKEKIVKNIYENPQ